MAKDPADVDAAYYAGAAAVALIKLGIPDPNLKKAHIIGKIMARAVAARLEDKHLDLVDSLL